MKNLPIFCQKGPFLWLFADFEQKFKVKVEALPFCSSQGVKQWFRVAHSTRLSFWNKQKTFWEENIAIFGQKEPFWWIFGEKFKVKVEALPYSSSQSNPIGGE